MTHGARIFSVILAFQLLIANPISLEYPIIPKIDCNDLNGNGHPDFIAVNSSPSPRSLYHVEYNSSGAKFLWEYSIPENVLGYFAHFIFGDFDNDGGLELIAAASLNGDEKIFYVFSADSIGFNGGSPQIMGISNFPLSITMPWKLYPMRADYEGYKPFIITQGSPNRQIIICRYIDGQINRVGSYGNEFLSRTMGPLELSLGNFDEDNIEDIFILSNGQNPEGYFIFSDGSEVVVGLDNYPRLRLLYNRGIDLNFDGVDDFLMINRAGGLMSNIWGVESILLPENNIQEVLVSLDNGLIHLKSISQIGKIGHYTIDPLTRGILTSEYNLPKFTDTEFVQIHSLMIENHILLINNGMNPELWSLPSALNRMAVTPPPDHLQRIYSKTPDYVIDIGNSFIHSINKDTTKAFLHFTGKYLPPGMEFNLSDVQLEWTPSISQLGYHELSYLLEQREIGDLHMAIENDMQLVSQKESILEENPAFLIYINDPVRFNNDVNHITFVNTKSSEWIIPINDNNVDALLKVQIISGDKAAEFQLLPFETRDGLSDSAIIDLEGLIQPTNLDTQFQDISNSKITPHISKFSWTPNTDQKDFKFLLTITDGYSIDTLTFAVTIHPEIDLSMNRAELTATVNQIINIPIELKQSLPSEYYTYELINAPENMWVTENGIINWIPMVTDVDDNIFQLKVSDGIATTDFQYNIYVNAPPVISSHPSEPFIINLGDSLSFPLENFDLNENAKLSWKLLSGPVDMVVSPEGVLIWEGDQLDYHDYAIQLSDGIDSIQWEGSVYVNISPVIISKPITYISENELYEYPLEAQDDNIMSPLDSSVDNKIEFKLLDGPKGMEIDYQNILRWNPDKDILGEFYVSIIASDGINYTSQDFQLLVNSFPNVTSINSLTVKIGDTLSFQIKANDSNPGDSLFYFIDVMRSGMNLDNNSGMLTWIPSKSDIGQHHFNLEVNDGQSKTGTNQNIQIFVYELPVFTGALSTEAFVGLEYSTFLTAEDMFGDKLNEPGAIIIENTTIKDYTLSEPYGRYFQWTPKKNDMGNHDINIRITDEYGFENFHTHRISVYKNPCFQCDGDPLNIPADTTGN